MGFGSIWHWVIVLIVVLVLFGRGRVADIMGEFGKGIKSFKDGMSEHDAANATPPPPPPAQIPSATPATPPVESTQKDQAQS